MDEWYIRYIAEDKLPRMPQTLPMSVGSAFDAYVKSSLYDKIYGKGVDPKFSFEALFEAQVEPHNRDVARDDGLMAYYIYVQSGAFADLLIELQQAVSNPHFEIEVRGSIDGQIESIETPVGGLILLGKPDLYFLNKEGKSVIYDWKVNGFYSKSKTSPAKGYVSLLTKDSRFGPHKDAILATKQGLTINSAIFLEDVDVDWGTQLATYGWICGELVGSQFIVGIDQLCGNPHEMRIAKHRTLISRDFQLSTYESYCRLQIAIESGHYFWNMSREDSDNRASTLDRRSKATSGILADPQNPLKDFL